jgi:hypothetical protein
VTYDFAESIGSDPNVWHGPQEFNKYDSQIWSGAMGFAFGLVVALVLVYRARLRCAWCGKRHLERDEKMTTEEYLRLYCGGWSAKVRELEARDRERKDA